MQGVNVISKNIISKTNSEEYSMAMRIVNKSMNIQKTRSNLASVRDSVEDNLVAKQIIDTLTQIITISISPSEVDTKVMDYYNFMSAKELKFEDKVVLTNMCAICAASYDYWSNNKDKWINLNVEKQSVERKKISGLATRKISPTAKRQVVEFVIADVTGATFGGPAAFICSGLVAWSW